jgi:hypothetical protein
MWPRIGYSISRAMIARTDSGEVTFNWSNVVGCAMSAGLSNAYYPPLSRTPSVESRKAVNPDGTVLTTQPAGNARWQSDGNSLAKWIATI